MIRSVKFELLHMYLAMLWVTVILFFAQTMQTSFLCEPAVPGALIVACTFIGYLPGRLLCEAKKIWRIFGLIAVCAAGAVLAGYLVRGDVLYLARLIYGALFGCMFFQASQASGVAFKRGWFASGTAAIILCSIFSYAPPVLGIVWFLTCMLCFNADSLLGKNLQRGNTVITLLMFGGILLTANFTALRQGFVWLARKLAAVIGTVAYRLITPVFTVDSESPVEGSPGDPLEGLRDYSKAVPDKAQWLDNVFHVMAIITIAALVCAVLIGVFITLRRIIKKLLEWMNERESGRERAGYEDEVEKRGTLMDAVRDVGAKLPRVRRKVPLNSLPDDRARIRHVYKALMARVDGSGRDTPKELLDKTEEISSLMPEFIEDYNLARYGRGDKCPTSANARGVYDSL